MKYHKLSQYALLIAGTLYLAGCGGGGGSSPTNSEPETSPEQSSDPTLTQQAPDIDWQWLRPQPQGYRLNDIVWFNDRYIAVGNNGALVTDADGTWTSSSLTATGNYIDIASNGDRLVAIEALLGELSISDDGETWSNLSFGREYDAPFPNAITWDGSRFVMLGGGGIVDEWVATSTDGYSWSVSDTTIDRHINALAAGNSLYIAAADGAIYYSSDGNSWQLGHEQDGTEFLHVYHDSATQTFLVGGTSGTLLASSDGSNWVDRSAAIDESATLYDIQPNGDSHLLSGAFDTGSCALYSSDDLTNWTQEACFSDRGLLALAGNGTGGWVGVGKEGAIVLPDNGPRNQTTGYLPHVLTEVATNGSIYLAAGMDGALWKSSGAPDWDWTPVNSGVGSDISYLEWDSDKSHWVHMSQDQFGYTSFYVSSDGENWAPYKSILTDTGAGNDLARRGAIEITVGAGLWETSDDHSYDGQSDNWLKHETSYEYNAVTTTDTHYVAVGRYGAVISGNWLHDMTESRPVTETLTDITTDGTRLVAVGD
ncbi:MAG: WD40/YVTN/BNR-like repeat-containing protein, partial [Pseudomonadota bacterium]